MTSSAIRGVATIGALAVTMLAVFQWLRWRVSARMTRRTTLLFVVSATVAIAVLAGLSRSLRLPDGRPWMLVTYELMEMTFGLVAAWIWSVWLLELVLAIPVGFRRARGVTNTAAPTETSLPSRREAIARVGSSVIAVASVSTVAWGAFRTRLDVETTEVPIRLARLPRVLEGFTIAQISDIHIGAFFGEGRLREVEDVLRKMKPDLIAMTGDLVDVQAAFIPQGASFLGRLIPLARHGVVAIPGNHEHYAGVRIFEDSLSRAGIDVLLNRGRLVAEDDHGGFSLVGVDDVSAFDTRTGNGPRVGPALALLPPDRARILLCHQPSYLPTAAANGFDLMLSGHTHGGQVAPVGTALVRTLYGNYAGLGELAGTKIYVNRGLGTSGPPVRVGVRPEITKIVLLAG